MSNLYLSPLNLLYSLSRPVLFSLPPEVAHQFSLSFSNFLPANIVPEAPVNCFGLHFNNPVGLAAGFDKNGQHLFGLSKFGFGFIEIGTLTPRPQPGNRKPRLFRLLKNQAIINRLGFNNQGIIKTVAHLNTNTRPKMILGINLGKNQDTSLEQALADYQFGLEQGYLAADYFAINISSPNTLDLRRLQFGYHLENLLEGIQKTRQKLIAKFAVKKPLLLKIAPDLTSTELENICKLTLKYQWDGLIATNTTIDRESLKPEKYLQESGGLSGKPLFEKSTRIVKELRANLPKDFPIIAVGGIFSVADALAKLQAGAHLLQIYTGFIYKGPRLIQEICYALRKSSL